VDPLIGVRIKTSVMVDGHWSQDSGDSSIFGLTTSALLTIVDELRKVDMLHCLQLLHFHQGSQIPNIRNIRDGVNEACRYYIELIREGAPMGYFNLGGGLAVDYDGSGTSHVHSRNYHLAEYCVDIVEVVRDALDPHEIPHPVLISESGRWTSAPTSVLLFNVLNVSNFDPEPLPDPLPGDLSEPVHNLLYTLQHIQPRRLQESYNDAIYYRDQLRQLFHQGEIQLREKALGENICLMILNRIGQQVPDLPRVPAALAEMRSKLCDTYYGNFSVFQSLPDAWAIGQVFPVMPLHRLEEKPQRTAIIADLTCDCDGKLNHFAGRGRNESTLMLHELKPGEDYYLGVFLVGAYQETLGDLHNLFGDTNVASVRVTGEGTLEFVQEIEGDTISDVLSYVEYRPQDLYQQFRELAESAVREGRITVEQRQEMLNLYAASLRGYTYFETS
jgi:arginine decarboxylase